MKQLETNVLNILRHILTYKGFKTQLNKFSSTKSGNKVDICGPTGYLVLRSKSAEIMEDLFFNYLVKIYLSQYRRNGGSAALENFFEKSTQPEVYLSFFRLSVAFLFVKWQLREVAALMCEREVIY